MMPVQLSCHKKIMVKNFQFHFSPTHSQTPTEIEHYRTGSLCHLLCSKKWNYYLQGSDIGVCNDHKPLHKFLNDKNVSNKVNRWSLELATHNITFGWISGVSNKAANCLKHPSSCLWKILIYPSTNYWNQCSDSSVILILDV